MSTATINSAAEYIQSLSPDAKQRVLIQLLREAVEHNDTGLLPIEDEEGKAFGYYVPPKAMAGHSRVLLPALTQEDRERTAAALASLDDTFDPNEFFAQLSRDDAKPS